MTSFSSRLANGWTQFWFSPAPPLNLAVARIVFAAHAFWMVLSRDLAGVSGVPAEFWHAAGPTLRWRYLLFPGHSGLEQALQLLALAALLAAMLGVFSRASCFLAGLLLYHLAPLETIIWTVSPYARGLTISVLALLVLAFSRSGECLALLPSRRRHEGPDSDFQWPVKLLQVFLAQIYFFSFYSKLVVAGWRWAAPHNMRNFLLISTEPDQVAVFRWFGNWLADHAILCLLIGVGTLLLEGAFFLVLFSPRARQVLVPVAVAFHLGVLFSMNIFFHNTLQLLIFVDWDRLRRRLKTGSGSAPPVSLQPSGRSGAATAGT